MILGLQYYSQSQDNMHSLLFCLLALPVTQAELIQRRQVVESFNVRRNASNDLTPLQVGNGNFAFGADITGLQTFRPFAIMSTWGWHNFSLPTTPNQTSVDGMRMVLFHVGSVKISQH